MCSRASQHDIKLNIRKDSIFEKFRVPIVQLYYLAFFCFTEKYSITKSVYECNKFSKSIGNNYSISEETVRKFFCELRNKIKFRLHYNWKKSFLGQEIGNLGFTSIEIDESAIIRNNHHIYWMFGLIDHITKEARIS